MNFESLSPEQLYPVPAESSAALFKRSVHMVEIEIFSYCNRRCWFCPNSTADRLTSNKLMPSEMYSSIIDDLASIEFTGMISYSRYNEPLADRVILERLKEARVKLPNTLLHTNTNGGYLNRDYLELLYDTGMRSLNIQLYLGNNDEYNQEAIKSRAAQTLKRVAVPSQVIRDEPGVWYEERLEFRDMTIRMYGRNFSINGTSRGDQVDIHRSYRRTAPCLMPFWSVYIDYNGSIVPCCNFRSDIAAHFNYVSGDLSKGDKLFQVYASKHAALFRRSLLNNGLKDGLWRNCHFIIEEVSNSDEISMRSLVATAQSHDNTRSALARPLSWRA